MRIDLEPALRVVLATRVALGHSQIHPLLLRRPELQVTRCYPSFLEISAWIDGLNPTLILFEVDQDGCECSSIAEELRRCRFTGSIALFAPDRGTRLGALPADVDRITTSEHMETFLGEIASERRTQ